MKEREAIELQKKNQSYKLLSDSDEDSPYEVPSEVRTICSICRLSLHDLLLLSEGEAGNAQSKEERRCQAEFTPESVVKQQ